MSDFSKDLRDLLDLDTAEGLAKYQATRLSPRLLAGIENEQGLEPPKDRESQPLQPYPARNEAIEKRVVTFNYTATDERMLASFNVQLSKAGATMRKKYKDKGPLWEPTEKTSRDSALIKAATRRQLKMDKKRAPKVVVEDMRGNLGLPDPSGLLEYAFTNSSSSQKANIEVKVDPVVTPSSPAQPSAQMKAKIEGPDRFRDPVLTSKESGAIFVIESVYYEVAITTLLRLAGDLCSRRYGEASMATDSNYSSYLNQGGQLIFSARVSMTDMLLSVKDYFASFNAGMQINIGYLYFQAGSRVKLGRSAPVAQPFEPPAVAGQRAIVLEEE
jgi:hypothetical protein